jgi:hypothetical protein
MALEDRNGVTFAKDQIVTPVADIDYVLNSYRVGEKYQVASVHEEKPQLLFILTGSGQVVSVNPAVMEVVGGNAESNPLPALPNFEELI